MSIEIYSKAKSEIKEKRILSVREWNNEARAKRQYILVYTLGNGSMADTERQHGYVVQKRHNQGGERSHFFLSREKAIADYQSNTF